MQSLRASRWVDCRRELMVGHEVAQERSRIFGPAGMAPVLPANPVDCGSLLAREALARPARHNRLPVEGTGADSDADLFRETHVGLAYDYFIGGDLAFDILIKARGWPPLRLALSNLPHGRIGLSARRGEASFLGGRRVDPAPADSRPRARTTGNVLGEAAAAGRAPGPSSAIRRSGRVPRLRRIECVLLQQRDAQEENADLESGEIASKAREFAFYKLHNRAPVTGASL